MSQPSKAVVKDSNTNQLREPLVFPNGFVSGDGSGLTGITSSGVSPTAGNSIVEAINNAATTESINSVTHATTSDSSTNSTNSVNASNLTLLSGIPIGTSTNGQVIKNVSGVVEWGNVTSGGTVTSITADSPLTGGTITASGNIGIQTASAIQSGAISDTDWNTFNGKLSPTGNGSGLTNLNASNISSGTIGDSYLSSNVGLKNADQTWTGKNDFTGFQNSFSQYLILTDNLNPQVVLNPPDGAGHEAGIQFGFSSAAKWKWTARPSTESYAIGLYHIPDSKYSIFIDNTLRCGFGNNSSPSEVIDVTGNIKASGQFKGSGAGLTANTVPLASLVATGTPSSSTYYRGDGTWSTPSGGTSYQENVIINPLFSINQRGYVSGTATTGANQYTLDRWRVVTSGQNLTFSTNGNGNQVTAPAGGVEQVVEGNNIFGGTYTLIWTGTATATVNGTSILNGGTISLTANTNTTVKFTGGTVFEAQLALGSSTFVQRLYGEELLLCKRYYQLFSPSGVGLSESAGTICHFCICLPVKMRATATVSLAAVLIITNSSTSDYTQSSISISIFSGDSDYYNLSFGNFTGLTAGVPYLWRNAGNPVRFDAEI